MSRGEGEVEGETARVLAGSTSPPPQPRLCTLPQVYRRRIGLAGNHSIAARGRLCASPQPWSVVSLNLRMSVATDPALNLDILVVACTMVATCNLVRSGLYKGSYRLCGHDHVATDVRIG